VPRVVIKRLERGRQAAFILDPKRVERSIKRAVNSTAKPAVIKMCQDVVAGKRYSLSGKPWKHKITFRSRFSFKGDDAILYVYPFGKNKEIWTYVSRGTKPHGIDAKNAPYLVFPYGGPEQMPKTAPEGITPVVPGGPTKWARVKHVDHPGTKARHFEERIGKDYGPKFRKLIHAAITRTL
jgi:hypothetical protein